MSQRGSRSWAFTLLVASLVLAALVVGTESSVIELGEFRIVQPKNQKLNAEVAFANFGRPEYGGDLQGHLAIPFEDVRVLGQTCEELACKYSCSLRKCAGATRRRRIWRRRRKCA